MLICEYICIYVGEVHMWVCVYTCHTAHPNISEYVSIYDYVYRDTHSRHRARDRDRDISHHPIYKGM